MNFLQICIDLSIGIQLLAILITVIRFVKGPTLPDRLATLDFVTALLMAVALTSSIGESSSFYIDIALMLSLVGFLSTMVFAFYLITRKI
jgi:multicomponent Na+:H+ antiporter subunit F